MIKWENVHFVILITCSYLCVILRFKNERTYRYFSSISKTLIIDFLKEVHEQVLKPRLSVFDMKLKWHFLRNVGWHLGMTMENHIDKRSMGICCIYNWTDTFFVPILSLWILAVLHTTHMGRCVLSWMVLCEDCFSDGMVV